MCAPLKGYIGIVILFSWFLSILVGSSSSFANDDWKSHYPIPNAAKKTVIVFIPGILGSRLIDPVNKKVMWGEFDLTTVPDLTYHKGQKFVSESLLDVEVKLFVDILGYSVYGEAVNQVELNAAATNSVLLKFHYDWRQSNYDSAGDLESWMCKPKNLEMLKESNILFVAHSMGGIVLKHWFHLFFDEARGCLNKSNSSENVLKVMLVGTPHFGSAEIVKNFFDGYSFGLPVADSFISERINLFAHTFPSIYELMPIQNNTACRAELEKFTGGVALEAQGRATAGVLDLFKIDSFKALKIPKTINESAREEFLDQALPEILVQARAMSCAAAKYNFPNLTKDKVVTYAGFVDAEDTPAAYLVLKEPLRRKDPDSKSIFLKVDRRERGDGTVTQRAARWASVVTDTDYQKDCRSSHRKLMDDVSVTNYLAGISQNAYIDEIKRAYAVKTRYDEFVRVAADQRRILAISPVLSDENNQFAARLNADIFKAAGITPDKMWRVRESLERPIDRFAVNWAYIAADDGTPERTVAAYEDIVTSLVTQNYEDYAIARLSNTINLWNSPTRTDGMAEIVGAAYNVRGALNFQMQNSIRARDDWIAAQSLGVTEAAKNLEHWAIQFGAPY